MNHNRSLPLIMAAAVLIVVAALAYSLVSFGSRAMYPTMTRAETERNDRLAVSIINTGAISLDDLNWSLRMLQTPSQAGEPSQTRLRHLEVMIALKGLRTFTPGQKERLYQATTGFLTSQDMPERIGAMAVMRATKDRRAIPGVKALLNDPDAFTRQMAQKTLAVLRGKG